jgi:hypothetical protein
MAKTAAKSAAKEPKKSAAKTSKAQKAPIDLIEKASSEALEKLRALNIESELQNDLEWCLGSYRADKNPVGLYAMAERALKIFEEEKSKKTKGITTKLISDLQKAIQSR